MFGIFCRKERWNEDTKKRVKVNRMLLLLDLLAVITHNIIIYYKNVIEFPVVCLSQHNDHDGPNAKLFPHCCAVNSVVFTGMHINIREEVNGNNWHHYDNLTYITM